MDEDWSDEDLEISDAVDRLVSALVDDKQRVAFEKTTALSRITYEVASRVRNLLGGNEQRLMDILEVDARSIGHLFRTTYSQPQFPEHNLE